eukprot:NODE_1961_length_406_cov_203.720430_g1951_i0.p1 GENE.NODE_1961_length_406_cov_203.720430_g1951_i0~~NODE_1961_length_406_cov_203.720430_g1951_i0.p1  ORF type:complete len:59 (+),score=5.65 NODE_1961_length_406_cov_203.720430_g1951_i0:36-212(+)
MSDFPQCDTRSSEERWRPVADIMERAENENRALTQDESAEISKIEYDNFFLPPCANSR